ncbi:phosphatase PAP2 family protein [Kitasatospora sp. MBT63]|uniref:phosphatase PAP2 family protein n=1 Tax=Kitasatospora sp. MBT63 TaxID=1444768 RepID=UPI0006913511|nr:phosphatase PAP2 family protein [Kitasatospora sp. MBT63]
MTARQPAPWIAACAVAFAGIAVVLDANHWAPLGFERAAVDRAVVHRPSAAVTAAEAVTSLGTGAFPYLIALAAGVVLVRAHRPHRSGRAAAALLLAPVLWLVAGQLLRQALMHGLGRPRPPAADWAFTPSGFAFPSGHAFTAATCAGLLALAVARTRPGARRAATVLAAAFAAVIGATRVYLGVHWPLDVIAGWLLATAWLLLGAALLRTPARRMPEKAPAERLTTSM